MSMVRSKRRQRGVSLGVDRQDDAIAEGVDRMEVEEVGRR